MWTVVSSGRCSRTVCCSTAVQALSTVTFCRSSWSLVGRATCLTQATDRAQSSSTRQRPSTTVSGTISPSSDPTCWHLVDMPWLSTDMSLTNNLWMPLIRLITLTFPCPHFFELRTKTYCRPMTQTLSTLIKNIPNMMSLSYWSICAWKQSHVPIKLHRKLLNDIFQFEIGVTVDQYHTTVLRLTITTTYYIM